MSTAQPEQPPAVIGSPAGYLSTHDLKRAGIGLSIVMVSAGLTYASQWASGQNFGVYTPFVLGGIYFLTDITRRWAGSTQVVPVAPLIIPTPPAWPAPGALQEVQPPPA